MSIAVRSGDPLPALVMVSPEQLAGQPAERPEPVNGTKIHPHCPECDGNDEG